MKRKLFLLGNRMLPFVVFMTLLSPWLSAVSGALAQENTGAIQWERPVRVASPEGTNSWFPDLAVDSKGRVHIVWSESGDFGLSPGQIESSYYSMWDGQQWSLYNDILPTQLDIYRTAIAVDDFDKLHILFVCDPPYGLCYKRSQADDALSAAGWTDQRLVNEKGFSYMSDISIYGDTLHILYDDLGMEGAECKMCADIYYRHSEDLGLSWSNPVSLLPTNTGSSRAQLEVDASGNVYVSWDEGWDRITGKGTPQSGIFMFSRDAGKTWSPPLHITDPASNNAQLAVGADGKGGIILVWRTTSLSSSEIYFIWTEDWGQTWSSPQILPILQARRWSSPFDIYELATDSLGHIHLLAVGHISGSQVSSEASGPPGLYHLEWDGNHWSEPETVYEGSWYPEYPHLVITRGNQFHATWFVREDPDTGDNSIVPQQVWYTSGRSQAPEVAPTTRPTPTPGSQIQPGQSGQGMEEATPTIDPQVLQNAGPRLPAKGLYTENDELLVLAKSIAPAGVLAILIFIFIRARRS
jgi:hypothetical protein